MPGRLTAAEKERLAGLVAAQTGSSRAVQFVTDDACSASLRVVVEIAVGLVSGPSIAPQSSSIDREHFYGGEGGMIRLARRAAMGLAAALVMLGPAVVSAQPANQVALGVTPSTDLTQGQVVSVHGQGFVLSGEHVVMQCRRGSVAGGAVDRARCDEATAVPVTADTNGAFTTPFTVSASITVGSGPLDCRIPGACEIVAVYATNNGPPAAAAPIEFAPAPTSTTTAAPAPVAAQPSFTG